MSDLAAVLTDATESAKLVAVADDSHKLGEFLDWLQEQGIHLAEWQEPTDTCGWEDMRHDYLTGKPRKRCVNGQLVGPDDEPLGVACESCSGTGQITLSERLITLPWNPTALLARYFNIDLDKVEQERRAMLEALRAS